MKYRTLGTTGIDVSLICLGTMTWGQQNSEAEGHAQMDYAAEQGVNFFDTAELYSIPPKAETQGATESIIGTWFQKTGKRKDIVLATKVVGPAPTMPWFRDGKAQLDAANINAACDASLKRLQTDYIDLYQLHWPQRNVNSFGKLDYDAAAFAGREADQILETLQALQGLVKTGKVRHIGLSNETAWGVMTFLKLAAANDLPRVQSVQNPYNLMNRSYDVALAEVSLQEKAGLLAYSPLAAGTLTGKYLNGALPAGTRRAIDARTSRYKRPLEDLTVQMYLDVAKKHGLDPAQMALAFVNARPYVTSNIIGATTMEHLKTNIASVDVALSPEAVADINAVHDKHPNPAP